MLQAPEPFKWDTQNSFCAPPSPSAKHGRGGMRALLAQNPAEIESCRIRLRSNQLFHYIPGCEDHTVTYSSVRSPQCASHRASHFDGERITAASQPTSGMHTAAEARGAGGLALPISIGKELLCTVSTTRSRLAAKAPFRREGFGEGRRS